ncbi:MAG: signal peptidase II [Ignavibacteriaceae bacterium]
MKEELVINFMHLSIYSSPTSLNDGRVIDYIILGTSNIHTAIFNLADAFVMAGMFLFVYSIINEKITKRN